jgi:cellulose synthase/poly-beta-1,6-N-acetylglucosamine synthase-like glycosyltransferase
MTSLTNTRLRALPIRLIEVEFEQSTKVKSLNAALDRFTTDDYDIALVLDADNLIGPSYLSEINEAFAVSGIQVVQTHRIAKNINTNMAYLDAVSEEMNNSIFRLGHANVGLSAALIGSGMAFDYALFQREMRSNAAIGGFDRVLEMKLLRQGVFIHYLPETYVRDEKVQYLHSFFYQRRRWLSAQYYIFQGFLRYLIPAIKQHNWDFCDKLYQQVSLSRLLLLGFIFTMGVVSYFVGVMGTLKWWALLVVLLAALAMAIPRYMLFKRRFLVSLCYIPYSFVLMVINLFHLKKASKTFIHTPHGGV